MGQRKRELSTERCAAVMDLDQRQIKEAKKVRESEAPKTKSEIRQFVVALAPLLKTRSFLFFSQPLNPQQPPLSFSIEKKTPQP